MRVYFAEIGGINTRYYLAGSGPPLLLIHGVGVSSDVWLPNISTLADSFTVCAPDTLGHGFTGSGSYAGGAPHPHLVEHLAALADYLAFKDFYVVGSSLGALLGALLYFRMRERVKKLVVVSSGSFVNTDEELADALKASYANGSSAIANPTLEVCRRRMERIYYDPSAVREELLTMQLTLYALPGAKEAYERRMKGMMDIEACRPYRVVDRLEEITLPTLLLWGLNDPRARYTLARQAIERLRDAERIGFDQCKHHPQVEHPVKFNNIVRKFLLRNIF